MENTIGNFKTFLFKNNVPAYTYIFITVLLVSAFKDVRSDIHVLNIDLDRSPLFITSPKFLSVALGSSLIAGNFENFDMRNPRLKKLMSALSPGYLRIGGSNANRLWFAPQTQNRFEALEADDDECFYEGRNCKGLRDNFTMTGEQWLGINKLTSDSGLKLLFDLNVMYRFNDGSWDSSNVEKLIEFSSRQNLSLIWELGNEPTLYKNLFNYELSATQLGKDFIKLRNILNKYSIYKDALLVGPDMPQPKPNNVKFYKYLQDFLETGEKAIDAVTWHQYNLNGNTAKYADFLNPEVFNELKYQIIKIEDTVRAAGVHKKPIWLGETANAYGGGAPGISDRFIATFLWLDKLGMAARYGIEIVIRQTLFKSHYALIDDDLTPLPDWWVSWIYKQLVGTKVISCNSESSKVVRLYCHCTKKQALGSNNSSITVFGLNLKNTEVRVQLRGIPSLPERIYAYILTGDLDLLSKNIVLNNEVLSLLPNGDVPQLKPKLLKAQPYLILPPYSLAFWVIPNSSFGVC